MAVTQKVLFRIFVVQRFKLPLFMLSNAKWPVPIVAPSLTCSLSQLPS